MHLDPTVTLLLVLVIGIALGILVERLVGRRGIIRSIAGTSPLTAALVGVAGSFIGFHVAELMRLGGGTGRLIGAALGALVVTWAWRMMR